jgi:exopolyphosphatase/pppGpp-phosphohydrolase
VPAAITTLAAVLEHFDRPTLVVAPGGIREGAILMMADESTNR